MTEETVQRLDFSKLPPWYSSTESCGWWPSDGRGELVREDESFNDEGDALAAAWEHYKEHNGPPGMYACSGSRFEPGIVFWGVGTERPGDGHGTPTCSYADARAAAWAWYERRLALADRIEDSDGKAAAWNRLDGDSSPIAPAWPRCLTWSDAEVAKVERWLVDATAEMPEVLRG